ncbi:hypothetical protein [Kitasatospora griseola]|uniref:hypothetical protein n=1 Tax=Kitasatospora griseola TaxID=2064 RepID=UPI00344600D3
MTAGPVNGLAGINRPCTPSTDGMVLSGDIPMTLQPGTPTCPGASVPKPTPRQLPSSELG